MYCQNGLRLTVHIMFLQVKMMNLMTAMTCTILTHHLMLLATKMMGETKTYQSMSLMTKTMAVLKKCTPTFEKKHQRSWNHFCNDCDDIETDNPISPGDVLEYCTINEGQTKKRCSVQTIVDSNHESYVILKNGTVLRPKTHSVRKIKFYNEYNHELIPNPLVEWHRLDKCILQPGSMNNNKECIDDDGVDGYGSDDATDEMDESEVHRACEQRRRYNKQRYGKDD